MRKIQVGDEKVVEEHEQAMNQKIDTKCMKNH